MTVAHEARVVGTSMLRAITCCLVAMAAAASGLGAQEDTTRTETNVPQEVKDLVVHILAFEGESAEDGAGIVVGMDADSIYIYIVTAAHVVEFADSIQVEFESARQFVPATLDTLAEQESGIDLAVIRISRDAALAAGYRPVLDRLGKSEELGQGDAVSPVGCPTGDCWSAPLTADRVLTATALEVSFQSNFVDGGSSGGGLFNRFWEVVGVVTNDVPPRAIALPIDHIMDQLGRWNVPVTLERPSVPRGGYGATLGVTVLAPLSGGGAFPDGRAPSGRVTLTRSLENGVDVNAGFLRLAPGGLGSTCPPKISTGSVTTVISFRDRAPCEAVLNAFTLGLGYNIKRGRFVARPFAELGIGKSRGRFDLGGVYVFDGLEYRPNLSAVEQTSFGGGGGLAIDWIALPRGIVQLLAAYWQFRDPFSDAVLPNEYDPRMPKLFVGLGLRMGF